MAVNYLWQGPYICRRNKRLKYIKLDIKVKEKVKCPMILVKHSAILEYGGVDVRQPFFNLGTESRAEISFTFRPIYFGVNRRLNWSPELIGMF